MIDTGLLQYLEGFVTQARKQRFEQVLQHRTKFLTVAIEDVYQLHNTSAVLRSCDAFGVQTLHVIEDRFGQRLDKNIAVGAEQWVDVSRYPSSTDCIAKLRDEGYQIVATTPHTDSCLLEEFTLDKKSALFFGTEKEGLSETVIQQADIHLKIPMVGFSESLNISVSAAIILQALTSRLRKSDLPWQLTADEMMRKRFDWTKKSIKNVQRIIERFETGQK